MREFRTCDFVSQGSQVPLLLNMDFETCLKQLALSAGLLATPKSWTVNHQGPKVFVNIEFVKNVPFCKPTICAMDTMKIKLYKNKANLRDLIAATGLVILLKFDPNHRFFVPCDLEIWWMALENNRAPLLYYIKLCASFQIHRWIQIGITVRKR